MNLDWFREWILDDPASRVPLTMTILGVLLVVPLFGCAAYLWRMAIRGIAERTFPPSGYRVIGKRPPITGDEALRSARVMRWLAMFLVFAAAMLVVQLWRLSVLLAR